MMLEFYGTLMKRIYFVKTRIKTDFMQINKKSVLIRVFALANQYHPRAVFKISTSNG